MFFSCSSCMLTSGFLVWLVVSPCWTAPVIPADGPSTPKNQLGSSSGGMVAPNAPLQGDKEAPLDLTEPIAKWMQSDNTKDKWTLASKTTGGAESWVQFEVEYYLKKQFKIPMAQDCREERVYQKGKMAADWVFNSDYMRNTIKTKPLIVELKVESSTIKGAALARLVEADMAKLQQTTGPNYKDHTKAIVVIAWSPESHKALLEKNIVPSDSVNIDALNGNIVKLYTWTPDESVTTKMSKVSLGEADSNSGAGDKGKGNDSKKSDPGQNRKGGQSNRQDETPSKKPKPGGRPAWKGPR